MVFDLILFCGPELVSTLRLAALTLILFVDPSAMGLGVLFFFGRSAWGSGLDEDGAGELLLFDGSVPAKSCTLFMWSKRFQRRGNPLSSWARSQSLK